MSLIEHAKRELKLAGLFDKDSDYAGGIGEAVVELMEVFAKQGHSGASASIVSDVFNKVSRYKNLTPLSGEDHEWNEVHDGIFQNNRAPAVFKEKETGKAYFLDAITWKTQTGGTWAGSAFTKDKEKVTSRQYIKSFPFTPKSFVIEVTEKEIEKDSWEFTVKDEADLLPVFEVYEKYNK